MTRFGFSAALTLIATATLVGCSSTRSANSGTNDLVRPGNSNRPSMVVDPLDAMAIGYDAGWLTSLGLEPKQSVNTAAVLGDLLICVEQPRQLVTAISMRDGTVAWRRLVGQPTESLFTPVRVDDMVLVNSETRLYGLDVSNGEIRQVTNLDSAVESGPVMYRDYAIFGGVDGLVFAHDIRAGYAKWSYKLPGRITTTPGIGQVMAIAADGHGNIVQLLCDNGDLLWRSRAHAGVLAGVTVGRTGVYIASVDRSLYALTRTTGRDRWVYRSELPLTQTPYAAGLDLFLPITGVGLVGIDAADGKQQWVLPGELTPILDVEDKLLVMEPGVLRWIEMNTGDTFSEAPTQKLKFALPADGGQLIVLTARGRIQQLVLEP